MPRRRPLGRVGEPDWVQAAPFAPTPMPEPPPCSFDRRLRLALWVAGGAGVLLFAVRVAHELGVFR